MVSLKNEDLYRFIEKNVPNYIINQIIKRRILSELDLQFRIISCLENKIDTNNDLNWKIHNCFYLKKRKKYPDLVLFRNYNPIICMELKFYAYHAPTKGDIKKDIKKLHQYFTDYPSLLRGYSFNIFNLLPDSFSKFERELRNQIKDSRIKLLNINTRNLSDYKKLKESFVNNFNELKKNFTNRESTN